VLAAKGCAWIADLRDGWIFEGVRPPFPTRFQERLDAWLERRMMRAADVVTCATRPVADDLVERMAANTTVVPNGLDPELMIAAAEQESVTAAGTLTDPGRVSIVYTGSFGGYGRDPVPMLRALRELAAEEPATAELLELVIAGPLSRDEREALDGLSPLRISIVGVLPRPRGMALQRRADVLLLLASPERTQAAGLKLFEYLGTGKPILALADGTEAGRIVAEVGGEVVPAHDRAEIKAAFRRAAMGELSDPSPDSLPARSYPAVAERMVKAVEVAIERSKPWAGKGDHRAYSPPRGKLRVRRLDNNPIVRTEMLPGRDGDNINGPSLIRVPDWMEEPLGKYHLYFSHHGGDYIRLAYADELEGPWKIHQPGTLRLGDAPAAKGHIASPDVHVDRGQIRMYFHAPGRNADGQKTFVATSTDGLTFSPSDEILGTFYFRAFQWKDHWYALAKGGALYRSRDGLTSFSAGPNPFVSDPPPDAASAQGREAPSPIRHVAVQLVGDSLWIYFTRVGDAPERILRTRIELSDDWTTWRPAVPPQEVLRPEEEYEGVKHPLEASRSGATEGPENAVRDPAIFTEGGRTWLIYSIAGESGLAMAEVIEG
jgi:hypothetical protein